MARPIELLAARSMAQNGVALAKRHDRSGGKLSRILSAMHALEAFLCMRETITDSRGANSPRQASIPGLRANNASRKVLLSSAKRKFREQLPLPRSCFER